MKNDLLAKYILGEVNHEERQIVERWLSEEEAHQREFQRIKRRVDLGSRRYKRGLFDVRQAALKVKFPAKRHTLRAWLVTAAVILLTLGIWYWNKPQYRETVLISQNGETRVFYLPDSSCITLAENSRLTYNDEYGISNRDIFLFGKAFFEVKRNTGLPFIVETSLLQVQVLGTSFQIITNDIQAEVFVEKGQVRVATLDKKQEKILETGMSVRYEKTEGKLKTFTHFDANRLRWKTGIFKFENAFLSDVIKVLNEYYGSHIVLSDDYATLRISVIFKGVSLKEAIEVINRTLDIQLTN